MTDDRVTMDSKTLVSDEEIDAQYLIPGPLRRDARAVADLAIRRFAERWGVKGRRVEGCVYLESKRGTMAQCESFTEHSSQHVGVCQPATLFIHKPPKPKKSDAEIVKAAEALVKEWDRLGFVHPIEEAKALMDAVRGDGD